MAIAFIDGSIKFYDIKKKCYEDLVLNNDNQVEPSYVEWRPYSKTCLACCGKYFFY